MALVRVPQHRLVAKGPRVARIIEQMQLRPASVLFVDDHPANLAEALAVTPDLQVAHPDALPGMLADGRFAGKDDRALTRLAQYRLLEERSAAAAAAGDNTEFLRGSGLRVTISHDLEADIDRAVELINRTNQLNFTKRRLPAEPEAARDALLAEAARFHAQVGLVHVRDRFGDYGVCGFYMTSGVLRESRLDHFCFSCRILGMGVEAWLYQRLGRPQLTVTGEVLSDPTTGPEVDWINTGAGDGAAADGAGALATRAVLRGGCELDAVAHYLRADVASVTTETNRLEWLVFLKFNTSTNLLLTFDPPEGFGRELLGTIGFKDADLASALPGLGAGEIGVFAGWEDAYAPRYRHKTLGLQVCFTFQSLPEDLIGLPEGRFLEWTRQMRLSDTAIGHAREFMGYIAQQFDPLPGALTPDELRANYRRIFQRIAPGARLFVLMLHERGVAGEPRHFYVRPGAAAYNDMLRALAAEFPQVELIDVGAFVSTVDDCQLLVDHFDRKIYYRIHQEIAARLRARPVLAAAHAAGGRPEGPRRSW